MLLVLLLLVADTARRGTWWIKNRPQLISATCHYFSFPPKSPCVQYNTTSLPGVRNKDAAGKNPAFLFHSIPFFYSFVVSSLLPYKYAIKIRRRAKESTKRMATLLFAVSFSHSIHAIWRCASLATLGTTKHNENDVDAGVVAPP